MILKYIVISHNGSVGIVESIIFYGYACYKYII